MIAEKWTDKVVEVKRISARLMMLRITVGEKIVNVVSAYAPQAGRSYSEKEEFWDSMMDLVTGIRDEESIFVGGDLNGHVGQDVEGFEGVHGGNGYGKRNLEGEMILEFARAMGMVVCNTLFTKEERKKVTYESGGNKSEVDYFMVRQLDKRLVKDVTVINGEACVAQHKLLICKIQLSDAILTSVKKQATKRLRLWKLKKTEVGVEFRDEVRKAASKRKEGNVDQVWNELKECLTTAANKTCGRAKGTTKKRVTWWWNNEVSEAVKKKRKLNRVAFKSKTEEDKLAYNAAKQDAKKAIAKAKDAECRKFGDMLDREDGRKNIYRIVKQITHQHKDVTESNCIKDANGKVVTDGNKVRLTWKEYFDKLLNEENVWEKDSLDYVDVVQGPSECITEEEVKEAIGAMKMGKATGPSGVVLEMLKAAGGDGVTWMTELFNQIISDGKIPVEWRKSWVVTVYKGKGDALDCGSYRGIKLLEHAMKVFERVIEKRVRAIVKLDEMQFGFSPGKGTIDAIFIVRQLQEKYLSKNKELWMAFVDLEKAFDRVPREVLWWSLRKMKVDEWLVRIIMSMYENVTTAIKVDGKLSDEFEVKVGVHQGSVLSPLLTLLFWKLFSDTTGEGYLGSWDKQMT